MFLFAHNLLIGHAKPGCRKDPNFLKTTIDRFKDLLNLADEHRATLVLTGKSIATMRLEHWLNVLGKIADCDVKILVIATTRPSDDLVALHNAGHLTLVTSGTRRTFNQRGEATYAGNTITYAFDGEMFTYDTLLNVFQFSGVEVSQQNVIQTDQSTPSALLVCKPHGKPFLYEQLTFESEADCVLMDYVDAIAVNVTTFGESKFIEALKRANNAVGKSITQAINELDASQDVVSYLNQLAHKAERFDEFSHEI